MTLTIVIYLPTRSSLDVDKLVLDDITRSTTFLPTPTTSRAKKRMIGIIRWMGREDYDRYLPLF